MKKSKVEQVQGGRLSAYPLRAYEHRRYLHDEADALNGEPGRWLWCFQMLNHHAAQFITQLRNIEGLAQIAVKPFRQQPLLITLHGIGRDGNDRNMASKNMFLLANGRCSSRPSMTGMLMSIRMQLHWSSRHRLSAWSPSSTTMV